ncbi:hypothetical protein HDU67_001351 [Dinochytrium kinnereticum]|nr:hypothetical protein HDU67_001351 [Dinochytrium kinnereticum]
MKVSIITLGAAASAAVVLLLLIRPTTKARRKGDEDEDPFPEVPGKLPIIGHFYRTLTVTPKENSETLKKLGGIVITYTAAMKVHTIFGGDLTKWALVKGEGKYLRSGWPARWMRLLGAGSAVTATGKDHRKLRGLIQKGLTKTVLSYFYPTLRENARIVLNKLAEQSKNGIKDVQPLETARTFTYDAICGFLACADQRHVEIFLSLRKDFISWTAGLTDFFIPEWMSWVSPFSKATKARERIIKAVEEVTIERKERMAKGETFQDSLGYLISATDEDGNELSMAEIGDNFITLGFAGNDTTTATICTCLHILLHEISEQELTLLRTELTSIQEPIEESTLISLPVLDAFIKETLRFCPPVAAIFKKVTEDVEVRPGKFFKAGSSLSIPLLANQYNEDIFNNPSSFRLSRFLVDEIDKAYPMDYTPFGAGARMCLGMQLAKMEIRVFILELFRGFEIKQGSKPTKVYRFPFNLRIPTLRISAIETN